MMMGETKIKVTKTKRSMGSTPPASVTSSPFLVMPQGRKYGSQIFINLSDHTCHPKSVPEMSGMIFKACTPDGWLLMLDRETPSCYLFNPISLTKIDLPPIPNNFSCDFGAITCSPTHDPNNCVVVLVREHPISCLFCLPISSSGTYVEWSQQDIEPECPKHVTEYGVDGISCQGKFYLLGLTFIAILDFIDYINTSPICISKAAHATVTIHHLNLPDLSVPKVGKMTTFLVESCGDIFVVHKFYLGTSTVVQTLDVFKLDLSSSLVLVKIKTLGDRIFLLRRSGSLSIPATQLEQPQGGGGLRERRDCIYFVEVHDTSLYRFDMGDGTITVIRICPEVVHQWKSPYWLVPSFPDDIHSRRLTPQLYLAAQSGNLMVKQQGTKVNETKERPVIKQKTWEDFEEILELVMSQLSLGDCVRFHLTCKTWLSIAQSPRSTSLPMQSDYGFQNPPWLLSFPKNDNLLYKFHHPIYNDAYLMDIPELDGTFIHNSKYGWLLVSKKEEVSKEEENVSYFFFLNPFIRKTIRLPDLPRHYYPVTVVGMTFSSPPTSTDCIVFGLLDSHGPTATMLVYRYGEDTWKEHKLKCKVPFIASYCNPVFCDGLFYCLGQNGKLGIFNANVDDANEEEELEDAHDEEELEDAHDEEELEDAHDEEELEDIDEEELEDTDEEEELILPLILEDESRWKVIPNLRGPNMFIHRSYIVECDGEILSVFIGRVGSPFCIFKLDRSSEIEMKWVKLESLGDKALFLSHTTAILTPTKLKGTEDRIHLPKFHEKQNVFYSLQTRRYHYFGTKRLDADWSNTSEEFQCTWIEWPADGTSM